MELIKSQNDELMWPKVLTKRNIAKVAGVGKGRISYYLEKLNASECKTSDVECKIEVVDNEDRVRNRERNSVGCEL